jgi:hypothetical protein
MNENVDFQLPVTRITQHVKFGQDVVQMPFDEYLSLTTALEGYGYFRLATDTDDQSISYVGKL